MTFFLKDQGIDENTPGRVSPMSEVPSYWDSVGANKRAFDLETNANAISGNYEKDEQQGLVASITGVLGEQGVMQILKEAGEYPDNVEVFRPELIRRNRKATNALLENARAQAAADPETWGDIDLSDEGIQIRVNARLQAEYQNAQDIIAMTPEEYTGEALVGGFGSALGDLRQAPFLLFGAGGGSLLRIAGREAAINAGIEAGLMGSQFDMSERLDIADPNVAQQIALAGAFGAVFGGGVSAAQRGYQAYRGRQAPPQNLDFGDMSEADVELMLNQAEDAILNNQPIPDMTVPPRAAARIPSEEGPIPPRDPDDPGPAPRDEPDTIEEALAAEANEASVGVIRRPLSDWMRNPRNATTLEGGGAQTMQIHPEGRAADELRNMGITPRTRPGLFSRNGRARFDNISASEMEETFPGIRNAVGDDGRYLDEDGLLRFLADELNGQPVRLQANERLIEAEAQLEAYRVDKSVLTRRIEAIEDGLDIEATQSRMNEIKAHVDDGIRRAGLDGIITPAQRADMASVMAERGGSVNDLLDAMDDADLTFAERNIGEPDGRPFAPRSPDEIDTIPDDAANAGEPGPGQRSADGPNAERGTEEGSAGGGRSPQRAGQGGSIGRQAFDDPGAATEMQRALEVEIRDRIERDGDFDVNMNIEGVELTRASDVLAYLDEGDRFAARISLCGV